MDRYTFEKIGYGSLPDMNEDELFKARKIVDDFLRKFPSPYYMFLNNESRYYTVFTFTNTYLFNTMSKEIMDIAKELGPIKSIEVAEDGQALEFWINYNNEGIKVFYLFDYAKGVIEV